MPASANTPAFVIEAFKPAAALADCITDIWLWELPQHDAGSERPTLTLLPDGHPTLVLVYGDPLIASFGSRSITTRSAVCGFQLQPVQVSCAGRAAGITVRLRPWALPCFVPMPMPELVDCRVDLRDALQRQIVADLEHALAMLPTGLARVRRVEQFLMGLRRAAGAPALVEHAVRRLTHAQEMARIGVLARELGATERTLERHFQQAVGVGPKAFARVMRLQSVLAQSAGPQSWTERALDAGYFDQAHLIRECRALFDKVPSFLAQPPREVIARDFDALARQTALPAKLFL